MSMTPENAVSTLRRQAQTTKRVQALRQRRTALGLTRIEIYAHPADHAAIKAFAAQIAKGTASSTIEPLPKD